MSRVWRPTRAPISEERRQTLRWVMGPAIWDELAPYMPETFVEAYDCVVEVLYGGDVTGVEEAQVTDGGKKVSSKWPLKDVRFLPVKAGMDQWAAQIASELFKARTRKGTAGHHRPHPHSGVGVEAPGSAGRSASSPQGTEGGGVDGHD